MESIIKFDHGSHWYSSDGTPNHDADLRVARKQGLYPSVTSIEKAWFANSFLEQWKANQLVIACVENQRQPHESISEYAQRVYEISTTKSRVASEFGKKIHSMVEDYPSHPEDSEVVAYYDSYARWHNKNVLSVVESEGVVLDHTMGIAGRFDKVILHSSYGLTMMDVKTQNVKKDEKGRKKPAFYDSWARQLAFYAHCKAIEAIGQPIELSACLSLVIDSNEPDEPFEKLWTKEEINGALEDFIFASYGWFKRKKFWPTKTQWNPCDYINSFNNISL